MASKTAILAVKVVSDVKQGQKGLDDYGSSVDRLKGGLDKMAVPAAAALAGLGLLAAKAGEAASNLEQATGAVESVFKANADQIEQYAQQAADNVGLAESQYKQLAAVFGSQLKNMGVAEGELASKTDELVTLGADLAATFGGTTADAVGALSSLLRGERDPIERYGVSIKQVDINARLAQMGLEELDGEAKKAAELQATLALLTEQTADAQGQFAREGNTAAGAQERANAAWENAQASLGEALLPLMAEGARIAAELAGWIAENSDTALIFAGVIGGVAAAILIMNGAISAYQTIQTIATAAQWAFNAAAAANPIGLVIIAIAALVALIVLLIANWEEVSRVAGEAIDNMIGWIADLVGWLHNALNALGELVGLGGLGDWVYGLGGDYNVAHEIAAASDGDATLDGTGDWPSWPAPAGGSGGGASAGGYTYNITVNGALDPDAVARQIDRILTDRRRTTGALSAAGTSW